MGTVNYAVPKYASKYYTVLNGDIEEFEYEDLIDNLKTEFELLDFNTNTSEYYDFDRNYPSKIIASEYLCKRFGDIDVEVEFTIIITSGYYEGATLDFVILFGHESLEYDNITDYIDELKCNSNMNTGMIKIQSGNIERYLDRIISQYRTKIEKVFIDYSDDILERAAVFSNGEGVYVKI